jgi:hypothetical protein
MAAHLCRSKKLSVRLQPAIPRPLPLILGLRCATSLSADMESKNVVLVRGKKGIQRILCPRLFAFLHIASPVARNSVSIQPCLIHILKTVEFIGV